MTLNELITKLETLRDDAPGNGDLPVFIDDWSEGAYGPETMDTFQVGIVREAQFGEKESAETAAPRVLFDIPEQG